MFKRTLASRECPINPFCLSASNFLFTSLLRRAILSHFCANSLFKHSGLASIHFDKCTLSSSFSVSGILSQISSAVNDNTGAIILTSTFRTSVNTVCVLLLSIEVVPSQ